MPDAESVTGLGARSALITSTATCAGLLARPCCLVPALLAVSGTGSAALTHAAITYRPVFLVVSGALLAGSLWLNVRLQAHPLNKWLVALAAVVSFALTGRPEWFASVW